MELGSCRLQQLAPFQVAHRCGRPASSPSVLDRQCKIPASGSQHPACLDEAMGYAPGTCAHRRSAAALPSTSRCMPRCSSPHSCQHALPPVQVLAGYPAAEVVWLQEEPENMGAWRFVKPRLDTAMRELLPAHARPAQLRQLRYVGRPAAASPGAPHAVLALPGHALAVWTGSRTRSRNASTRWL